MRPAGWPDEASRTPLREVRGVGVIALAMFLCCLALYLSNGRTRAPELAGDTGSNRLLPFSLLRFGTLTLEPFRAPLTAAGPLRWYVGERRGRLVANYPVGTALVALPVYVPIVVGLALRGRTSAEALFRATPWSEKAAASVIAASAVAALFLVLARRVSRRRAALIAVTLGCCTLLWSVGTQLLWQHGPGVLVLTIGFLVLDRRPTARTALLAGCLFGLLYVVRPMTLPFAAAAVVAVVVGTPGKDVHRVRYALAFLAGFATLFVPNLAYNLYYFGSWLGLYAQGQFSFDWLRGPLGLLVSPNRGMLIFMPIAALGLIGAVLAVRRWRSEPLLVLMLGAALAYYLLHAWGRYWAGGWSFGPRYVIEVLPVLAIAASLVRVKPRFALLVALAWAVSFAVQASGAYVYPASNWHGRMGEDMERAAWDWRHVMLWEDWRAWREGQPRPALP
jgi:hypothetical protein